jgi:hypothetical protein
MLKRPNPVDEQARFKGQLRHYHRSGSTTKRTWDEWVDGKSAQSRSKNWLKILLISIAVLGLVGIIAGLIIELR